MPGTSMKAIFVVIYIFCLLILNVNISLASKSKLNLRIVGGRPITIKNAAYQVAVLRHDIQICGGSLIHRNWVITAAHCVFSSDENIFTVRIGSMFHSFGGKVVGIKSIIRHSSYAFENQDYDFALLLLNPWYSEGVTFGLLELPRQNEDIPDGTVLRVTGWGHIGYLQESGKALRCVDIPKVNQLACKRKYRGRITITNRMICAGFEKGGKDSCQKDSGGPLVHGNVLVGIVSFGFRCGVPGMPGVYARVASVRNWIHQQTGI